MYLIEAEKQGGDFNEEQASCKMEMSSLLCKCRFCFVNVVIALQISSLVANVIFAL